MDIQQLKLLKVLIIGDSCTDVYTYGSCERMSPEAPVPILKMHYWQQKPGMALNVQKNLEGFGHETKILTNTEDIIKSRYIDLKTKQHLLRVDSGENRKVKSMDKSLIDTIKKSGFEYDCVVVSDYDKGFVCSDNCLEILKSLKRENTVIFVDSKKADLTCFEGCIIKLNEFEFKRIKDTPANSEMIVTLGPQGAKWNDQIFPTEKVDVFDVCGAGDTFLAAFVTAYMSTFSFPESIKFANHCASISVKKSGNYVISLEDIK